MKHNVLAEAMVVSLVVHILVSGLSIETTQAEDNFFDEVNSSLEINEQTTTSIAGEPIECFGETATIIGTADNDAIYGTADKDVIVGLAGNDLIFGLDGDDIICGMYGNDGIYGGSGDDMIYGEEGRDMLWGNDGNDILYGGSGRDELRGGDGNDFLYGEEGNDILIGGYGYDRIDGGSGNDKLYGGQGNDLLLGSGGDDDLISGSEEDGLDGGEGIDALRAGTGKDLCINGEAEVDCEYENLTLDTDKSNYRNGEEVILGGNVPIVLIEESVNIEILNPNSDKYTSISVKPEVSGIFFTHIILQGEHVIGGTWTVKASYFGLEASTTIKVL